ncbi:VOC family protein [Jatrophihabitans endophyticus]|uniref:VOC family protein n=1 Tax=Jatrophihabitans endophyticus TaxID=1206085 RepID=UPI0019DBBC57|nr:VOC family protein [Jatrophihabitans endophyticus]MBE7187134.1 glyoxalase [Jatrophihabitans endophyticus]
MPEPATIVFPVSDLDAAKAVYTALLGEPYADTPYYVGYRAGGPEVALDPTGHQKGMTGPVVYWPCDDIRARLDELAAAGATLTMDATDVGGGMQVGFVTDADGNHLGFTQAPA